MPSAVRVFLIAGEHSGDHLGARLIAALRELSPDPISFAGVGGDEMAREGCPSLFPLSELAIMSPAEIILRLRFLRQRVRETAEAALRLRPDIVVLLDSPEFTHAVAKRVRKRAPSLRIVNYVSPSVWAWRSGRAKRMRRYIDHVLAILPFEPETHARLGGPPCTYVGHPLVERFEWLQSLDPYPLASRLGLDLTRPIIVVLPGSRGSEVRRLMQPFGQALALMYEGLGGFELLLPTVKSALPLVEQALPSWPVQPHILMDELDKFRAFKLARASLAASGTVTLELALSGSPMVVAYRVDRLAANLRWLLSVQSIVLPNLILGRNVFPEFVQEDCSPEKLALALAPLIAGGDARTRQQEGLREVPQRMRLPNQESPSRAAARIVLEQLKHRPEQPRLAPLDRDVVPLKRARVDLPRPADSLTRVRNHLLPLRDPPDRTRDRE